MDSNEQFPNASLLGLWKVYQSPIGKKLLTGMTGLALVTFVLVHMLGNLLLFAGHDIYNQYAYHLEQWWPLLYAVEVGLVLSVLGHGVAGMQIFIAKRRARPVNYAVYRSVGAPSHQSISSRTMIVTGGVLGIFLVSHLRTFKFGVAYSTAIAGVESRDLARLVVETFHHPLYAFSYSAVMVLLGFHLRHGLWSALQSLGASFGSGVRPIIYGLATLVAILVVIGFITLPLGIYWGWVN